jgi:hypothetical protein
MTSGQIVHIIQPKGMTHMLRGTEQDGARVHHPNQNGVSFKTYGLFISGVFHLILLEWYRLWEIDTVEHEMQIKGATGCVCYCVVSM